MASVSFSDICIIPSFAIEMSPICLYVSPKAGRETALILSRNHAETKHIPIYIFYLKGIYKHQHRTNDNMNNSVEMWRSKNKVSEVCLLEVASKISALFTK